MSSTLIWRQVRALRRKWLRQIRNKEDTSLQIHAWLSKAGFSVIPASNQPARRPSSDGAGSRRRCHARVPCPLQPSEGQVAKEQPQ